MVTPSGSCPAGSQAAAALGASENGLYVSFALGQEVVSYDRPLPTLVTRRQIPSGRSFVTKV